MSIPNCWPISRSKKFQSLLHQCNVITNMSIPTEMPTYTFNSVFTPFAEEFLFRGFILTMLLKRYSPIVSIVISSFVFSIAHEPIAMALAFGGGCLYGWLRVKTGSIYPSMIAHAIWNGFITLVVIFA